MKNVDSCFAEKKQEDKKRSFLTNGVILLLYNKSRVEIWHWKADNT